MLKAFEPLTQLGNINIETFLREYWQKKPLHIPNAFPDLPSLISADELAGLAIEDEVVSRLVVESRKNVWSMIHGPLNEDVFETLPEKNWTLLVQHLDSLDPQLNSLLNAFRFIPNWRLDDIMASFSCDGGSLGPHFDYFDVFLLQAEGQKRWRLGQECSSASTLLPDLPLKILEEFTQSESYTLTAGDLLYIPARRAHWGEALGDSLGYSIGFRAPSYDEIILDYSQDLSTYTTAEDRYQDPDLKPQRHSGEIPSEALEKIKHILHSYYADDEKLRLWFGEYATQTKQDVDEHLNPISVELFSHATNVRLNTFCRSAFSTANMETLFFVNGRNFSCSQDLAIALTEHSVFSLASFPSVLDRACLGLLAEQGFLEVGVDEF